MTPQQWLQKELRLLYEYGESTTFERDAERILADLERFSSEPLPQTASLVDALDQAGVPYTRIELPTGQTDITCDVRLSDGAPCGEDVRGTVCARGHEQN